MLYLHLRLSSAQTRCTVSISQGKTLRRVGSGASETIRRNQTRNRDTQLAALTAWLVPVPAPPPASAVGTAAEAPPSIGPL